MWEAQYGDFINGAQIMLDEYLTSGRAKWGMAPSLVLLLPHGYEGQGPDHSSARLERFLNAAADTNMRIANCTTAAQYFHLLRRQALLLKTDPLPLVVMTPKSLLRHPLTASAPAELAEGRFQLVIDDEGPRRSRPRCGGSCCAAARSPSISLTSEPRKDNANVAIVRVEQLYPFPDDAIRAGHRPATRSCARSAGCRRSRRTWARGNSCARCSNDSSTARWPLRYIGRVRNSSPSEGSSSWHAVNQRAIVGAGVRSQGRARRSWIAFCPSRCRRVMSTNIVVPELGESVVEARVAKWLKKEGDAVSAGDALVELETEKIDLEVSADRAGVLTDIKHQEGADVKVGEVLAVLEEATPNGSDQSTTGA